MALNNPYEMSGFASRVMEHKYAHELKGGGKEPWRDIAKRQRTVLRAVDAPKSLIDQAEEFIALRKFMPGGRYLYAVGRPFHQTQNCLLLRAEDSREGWSELMQKITMALMTGAGIGVDYSAVRPEGKPIRKTGGFATGPLALMQMVNEAGRGIMQGGSRRSAIWAGLKWSHPDIHKFIVMKNWISEVCDLKVRDYNFPATMDGTNISVQLDDEFFEAYHDDKHAQHSLAHSVYWATVEQMLRTAEPGFSVDTGKNVRETLRNAPVCAGTHVLTSSGYKTVGSIVGIPTRVWTGKQWAPDVVFTKTFHNVPVVSVIFSGGREIRCEPSHEFLVEKYSGAGSRRKLDNIVRIKASDLRFGDILHDSLPEADITPTKPFVDAYTMGFLFGDGSFNECGGADLTFCDRSKLPCFDIIRKSGFVHSVNTNDSRGYIRMYLNELDGEHSKEGLTLDIFSGSDYYIRSFIAGLFDADGNYDATQHRIRLGSKHKGFLRDVARLLEQIGILAGVGDAGSSGFKPESPSHQLVVMSDSVNDFAALIPTQRLQFGDGLFKSYRRSHLKVKSVLPSGTEDVYCADVKVPEHSFMAEGIIVSNCTEVTSCDDSDICNLGSINLARIESLEEMQAVTEVATAFLLAGTVYSDVPYPKVDMIRTKNRRLGLGLMGIHEWLMMHGKKYGADEELDKYLHAYQLRSDSAAAHYADHWDLSRPVKTRAIAPTGTIGIVAETTTGIEPMLASAYKRRYLKGSVWNFEYVIDPTAKRMVEQFGVKPEDLEDAYSLAHEPERRVEFQVHLQKYVDHSISSTINLPSWGSELNNRDTVQRFGRMLIKHLVELRGITCYPDGARGGQPLTAVKFATAAKHTGEVHIEAGDICDITRGGSCGS